MQYVYLVFFGSHSYKLKQMLFAWTKGNQVYVLTRTKWMFSISNTARTIWLCNLYKHRTFGKKNILKTAESTPQKKTSRTLIWLNKHLQQRYLNVRRLNDQLVFQYQLLCIPAIKMWDGHHPQEYLHPSGHCHFLTWGNPRWSSLMETCSTQCWWNKAKPEHRCYLMATHQVWYYQPLLRQDFPPITM